MFKNYLTTALRILSRNKTFSLINILGLTLGITCCLLLSLYIENELEYDRHHQGLPDLYRVITHFDVPRHGFDKISTVSPPIAPALQRDISSIHFATRLFPQSPYLFQNADRLFYETDGFVVDSTLFDVLTFKFLEGTPSGSLVHPNTIVISDEIARKLFGTAAALNQTVSITPQGSAPIEFRVTGVFKSGDLSHLKASFFVSLASEGPAEYLRSETVNSEWAGMQFVTSYVRLRGTYDLTSINNQMNEVLRRNGSDDMKALGFSKTLTLEPVSEIYLRSDVQQTARITYVYVVSSIAVFILLIACINFMNLSTARAIKRAAEFGVRKVLGARRISLVKQIMAEAFINVVVSVVFALIIAQLALPMYNQLTGKSISITSEKAPYIALALAALTVVTTILAGSYPALYFSSFQPVKVLKSRFDIGFSGAGIRKILVTAQFTIAIVLVCGVITISEQLQYLNNKNLGFNPDAKLIIPMRTATAKESYHQLKTELQRLPEVIEVSAADYMPGINIVRDMPFYAEGGDMSSSVVHKRNFVDYNFQRLLDIGLLSGRSFTDNRALESNGKVILNETSMHRLGLTVENAVGTKIYSEWQGEKSTYEIIGVMEDYHQTSLHEEILPTMFEMSADPAEYDNIIAEVDALNLQRVTGLCEQIWNKSVNDTPFEFSFLDQSLQKHYESDQKLRNVISIFSVISVMISCLGLYGLSSFMAERRVKEIGIRKVMGANVSQIVSLMSTEYVRLVLLAFILSVPVAWYAMNEWLQSFAYQVDLGVRVYLLAGLIVLAISLITVSFELLKAAIANPAKSLQSE